MPERKHLQPVKLTDIPATKRLRAAHRAIRDYNLAGPEALEIQLAALSPSKRTYWILQPRDAA